MKNLNKLILLFTFVLTLLGSACKKEIYNPIDNPTSYVLTKMNWDDGTPSHRETTLFTYNSDHIVSGVKLYRYETSNTVPDTSYYNFSYTNGLCSGTIPTAVDGNRGWTYQYKHPGVKPLIKSLYYYSESDISTYQYVYDAQERVVAENDTFENGADYFNYQTKYNDDNNLTSISTKFFEADDPVKQTLREFTQFDDKVNFLRTVNGLPATFWYYNGGSAYSYSLTAPNNVLTENDYYAVPLGQPYTYMRTISFSYEYNDAGLPTKMTRPSGTFTFEYEKYK